MKKAFSRDVFRLAEATEGLPDDSVYAALHDALEEDRCPALAALVRVPSLTARLVGMAIQYGNRIYLPREAGEAAVDEFERMLPRGSQAPMPSSYSGPRVVPCGTV